MVKALSKPKKAKAKQGKTTLMPKGHVGSGASGHETRLKAYVKEALEQKRKGISNSALALHIADKYNLERVPSPMTISRWLRHGNDQQDEAITELQVQIRLERFSQIEAIIDKWLPIATAERFTVQKWKTVEGEPQPFFDENALDYQLEATDRVIKAMAREGKMLALDLDQTKDSAGVPMTLQQVQLLILDRISQGTQQKAAGGIVLELEAGVPDMEEL